MAALGSICGGLRAQLKLSKSSARFGAAPADALNFSQDPVLKTAPALNLLELRPGRVQHRDNGVVGRGPASRHFPGRILMAPRSQGAKTTKEYDRDDRSGRRQAEADAVIPGTTPFFCSWRLGFLASWREVGSRGF